MKHDEFLLDIRHDGEIYAEFRTVEGEVIPEQGRINLDSRLRGYLNADIQQLEKGDLDQDGMIRMGETLYEALFPDRVGSLFEAAEKEARERYNAGEKGRRLRLIIKVDERNREVLNWPMEFLHLPRLGYLSTTIHIALSRQLTIERRGVNDRPVPPPLKVLIVVSGPEGLDEVMSAKTVEEIVLWAEKESSSRASDPSRPKSAVSAPAKGRGRDIEIRLLGTVEGFERPPESVYYYEKPATFHNIQAVGEDWTPHVLHFVGHGGVANGEGEIGLIEDEYDASVHWTRAEDFSRLFATWQPRLVVLQACQSAQADTGSGFMHSAGYLVQKGIPAVVAMQFEIRNDFATEFSTVFYRSLAKGLEIDAAVQDGRKDIATLQNLLWKERHFGAPVLFMWSGNPLIESKSGLEAKIEFLNQEAAKYRQMGERDLARQMLHRALELEEELEGVDTVRGKAADQLTSKDSRTGHQDNFTTGG